MNTEGNEVRAQGLFGFFVFVKASRKIMRLTVGSQTKLNLVVFSMPHISSNVIWPLKQKHPM
jgi:hypothetical protein